MSDAEILEREQESEHNIPKTRMCKCGRPAEFIKDYWVTESKHKKEKAYDDNVPANLEVNCGILRRRFCPSCLSKIAAQQRTFNKRLNIIIIISIFLPFAIAAVKYAFDYFVSGISGAFIPMLLSGIFTVCVTAALSWYLLGAQARRSRIEKGNYSDMKAIDSLIDSLNYGITDYKQVKDIPSVDVVTDGDGRVNYEMERSGYSMKIMLEGRVSLEPMTERMKYPFKDDAEYMKRTYVNAGLFDDNMKAVDEKELSEKDFAIKNGALLRYSGLAVTITIPDNVEMIAERAFKNSKNCETVIIPESVRVIEKEAFSGCPASKINLPKELKEIKPFTFYRSAVTEAVIPEGVESIGESAFFECFSLERVVIPASCKKVGANAFKGCSALRELVIEEGVEALSDYSFNGCSALKTVKIPDGVYEIGNFAFEGCNSLESLYLPDTIQFMGGRAFEGNTGMIIYGKEGSYAEQFAAETRKRFELIADKKKLESSRQHRK